MGFLSIFDPAPHVKPIENPQEVKRQYDYWRIRTFYSMYLGYAFYYLSRKSFTFAMPALKADLGFRNDELGILASVFAVVYGISKFTSGILADRSNPRYFISVGLILTGIFNICFGMSSSLWAFILFWGLNGWFQGFGWPGCTRFLTNWYSQSERGRWWGFTNTSHNVGGAAIPLIVGYCLYYFDWRSAMYIPGLLCILLGLFLINRLRDTPQSIGLPAVEVYRNDYASSEKTLEKEPPLTTRETLFKYVFSNPYIWLLGLAYFFVYVVRTAVNDWSALFLVEQKAYTKMQASQIVCWFEIGGFFGSLISGWCSDWIFKGKRGPVNLLFTLGTLGATLALKYVTVPHFWWDALMLFLQGFFVFGPQMLIGIAASELANKRAAATANGFVGIFAYLGSAAAGYPLGKILQEYGWNQYFIVLSLCCAIAAMILLPMWHIRSKPQVHN
jgi:OPA family sugar phosphate sensor protein UhpC-like MFS transporter